MDDYDEFGLFHENAQEAGLGWDPTQPPSVRRAFVDGPSGHRLSALVWGDEPPEVVFLHGGAQNAHTWDTVALALDRPVLAVDLPGHGHSDWRASGDYRPQAMAGDLAATIEALAPSAHTLVGMSLGGLSAVATLAEHPQLVERLAVVDVTPGVNRDKAAGITAFIAGPEVFASFDEILDRTIAFNPTRSPASLRRGVLHNARPRDDGTWEWRYDRPTEARLTDIGGRFTDLWDAFGALEQPLLFCKGETSPVVDEEDLAELRRRRPDVEIVVVEGAGHSIQGDRPVELAALLERFIAARR
jgi:pimeloyl-ACP methyl ester carboxylesterase